MPKMSKKEKLTYYIDKMLTDHYLYNRMMSCKPTTYKQIEDKRVSIEVDTLYTISCIKITLKFDGWYMYHVIIDTTNGTYSDIWLKATETLCDMNTVIQSLKIGGYIK